MSFHFTSVKFDKFTPIPIFLFDVDYSQLDIFPLITSFMPLPAPAAQSKQGWKYCRGGVILFSRVIRLISNNNLAIEEQKQNTREYAVCSNSPLLKIETVMVAWREGRGGGTSTETVKAISQVFHRPANFPPRPFCSSYFHNDTSFLWLSKVTFPLSPFPLFPRNWIYFVRCPTISDAWNRALKDRVLSKYPFWKLEPSRYIWSTPLV